MPSRKFSASGKERVLKKKFRQIAKADQGLRLGSAPIPSSRTTRASNPTHTEFYL